ncbi:MAG TPA: potassium channel family protein [Acidimicrobiales bacterium]
MVSPLPKVLFPATEQPLGSLLRRIGVAVGLLLLVTVVTWLGRDGYRDLDGDPVSALDAFYYASVTLTTTGYGDVTPVSPAARAVTAFVVTPARVLFLIVLVGTTIELLTERFRHALAESRWRKRMSAHTVVVGYGATGRGAVASLRAAGTPDDRIVVVDRSETALHEAQRNGLTCVQGDATRTEVLRTAGLPVAHGLIVACGRDDTATLITLTGRELSPTVRISAAVRETENAHLLKQSGADTVIVSAEAAGHLLGQATDQPHAVSVFEDLLVMGNGLDLLQRPVAAEEVGGPPRPLEGRLPVALIRGARRIAFGDADFAACQPGDVVVSIAVARGDEAPTPEAEAETTAPAEGG